MKLLHIFTKGSGFCAIALIGLVGCNQPANIQADAATPSTQNRDTQIAQTISADDAAERVEDALENHQTLRPFDLDADDEGNEIVIKGTVRTTEQRTLAEDIAKRTAPGFTIINRVNVQ